MNKLNVSGRINDCLNRGHVNLHINIYYRQKILFQIMLAKHFVSKGIEVRSEMDFAVVHFFSKAKKDLYDKFLQSDDFEDYLFFEECRGIFTYVNNIGKNAIYIEEYLYKTLLETYSILEKDVVIEFSVY
ncbi:hypothetical protein [Vallitalea sp.]|jgi:hypothetical protein|uniref:hypothetical protein n=1 Tax=Vallitalea sp. TaxID=1882829 RepID=UPI0025F26B32|nr:hypothetical protein [Vallitalea sp.]MCT4687948.1 hypothetical protein [Vallitalea sp.]